MRPLPKAPTHRPLGEPHSLVPGGHGAAPPAEHTHLSPPAIPALQPSGQLARGEAILVCTLGAMQMVSFSCLQLFGWSLFGGDAVGLAG
jgi:hypothetical protein